MTRTPQTITDNRARKGALAPQLICRAESERDPPHSGRGGRRFKSSLPDQYAGGHCLDGGRFRLGRQSRVYT